MGEDEGAKGGNRELLADVMEVRERIEEVETEEEIIGLKEENEARIKGVEERMGGFFERAQWEEARMECVRLRYWVGVRESLNSWEKGVGTGNMVH